MSINTCFISETDLDIFGKKSITITKHRWALKAVLLVVLSVQISMLFNSPLIRNMNMKYIITGIMIFLVSASVFGIEGMASIKSDYSVNKTADRFIKILEDKGLTFFNRINHQKNAETAGLVLRPTELIIFGNPKIGTPLMHCAQSVVIDLPQKVLIYKDDTGKVWISYNEPQYLKARHNIVGCDKVFKKISHVLAKLSQQAAKGSNE